MADQSQHGLVNVTPLGSSANARNEECLICLEPLGPESPALIHTVCQQACHNNCLLIWVEQQENGNTTATCPMCRGAITIARSTRASTASEPVQGNIPTNEEQLSYFYRVAFEQAVIWLENQVRLTARLLHDNALCCGASVVFNNLRRLARAAPASMNLRQPIEQACEYLTAAISSDIVQVLTTRFTQTAALLYQRSLHDLQAGVNGSTVSMRLEYDLLRLRHRTIVQWNSLCSDISDLVLRRTSQELLSYADSLFTDEASIQGHYESIELPFRALTQASHEIANDAIARLHSEIPYLQFARDPVDFPGEDSQPYPAYLETLNIYIRPGVRRRHRRRNQQRQVTNHYSNHDLHP